MLRPSEGVPVALSVSSPTFRNLLLLNLGQVEHHNSTMFSSLTNAERDRCKAVFNELDLDQSHSLDVSEFYAALNGLGKIKEYVIFGEFARSFFVTVMFSVLHVLETSMFCNKDYKFGVVTSCACLRLETIAYTIMHYFFNIVNFAESHNMTTRVPF